MRMAGKINFDQGIIGRTDPEVGNGGVGALPYIKTKGMLNPQRGTKILFYGLDLKFFFTPKPGSDSKLNKSTVDALIICISINLPLSIVNP